MSRCAQRRGPASPGNACGGTGCAGVWGVLSSHPSIAILPILTAPTPPVNANRCVRRLANPLGPAIWLLLSPLGNSLDSDPRIARPSKERTGPNLPHPVRTSGNPGWKFTSRSRAAVLLSWPKSGPKRPLSAPKSMSGWTLWAHRHGPTNLACTLHAPTQVSACGDALLSEIGQLTGDSSSPSATGRREDRCLDRGPGGSYSGALASRAWRRRANESDAGILLGDPLAAAGQE